jgi:DNA-binding MarR family transcriptional regulator
VTKKTSAQTNATNNDEGEVAALDSRVVFLLSQIGHHVSAAFTEQLRPIGIQPRHFAVLHSLAARDGQTQQELANQLKIHRNVMVGVVDDLERLRLAKRVQHLADRRAYALRVTPGGRAVLKAVYAVANELESHAMNTVSDLERITLLEQLQRIASHLGLQPGSHPKLAEPK